MAAAAAPHSSTPIRLVGVPRRRAHTIPARARAMHLSGDWARRLYPNLAELVPEVPSLPCVEETLRVAGLLHDVGHGPFGHFFDQNYLDRFGIDHEVIGRSLILGDLRATIAALD